MATATNAGRRRICLLLGALMAACLAFAPAASAESACTHPGALPWKTSERTVARATVCLLNVERKRHGLQSLHIDLRLGHAAAGHSAEMSRRKYFSHNSRSGASFLDRIRRAGYLRRARRWSVGENIAWGTGALGSPRLIVRAWMHSPGHRANILTRSFRHIGIGISAGVPVGVPTGNGATYTTDFGMRG